MLFFEFFLEYFTKSPVRQGKKRKEESKSTTETGIKPRFSNLEKPGFTNLRADFRGSLRAAPLRSFRTCKREDLQTEKSGSSLISKIFFYL